jgi:DNA-binding Lrp family transcriptional regulator
MLKNNDLICLYSEDAKIKIKELAILFKTSSQLMKYSLNNLEKEGYVYNPFCIFDYSYFGLMLFRVYFKGAYVSDEDKSNIVSYLLDHDYVAAVYELSGEFDLVVEFLTPNPSRFNKELKELSDRFPTLANYKVILNIVTHLYPKLFLTQNPQLQQMLSSHILIGGDRSVEHFDRQETKVMKSLLESPKARNTFLARKSGLNPKTTKSVIASLKKRSIIKGCKYVLNIAKLDISKFRLFLRLHNLTKEREAEFMNYLFQKTEVTTAQKTVGDWDIEIDLESLEKQKIRVAVMELRSRFKDIIANFNMMEFYGYYKRSYLPKYLFEIK